ncbi:MAG: glutathione S-transferase family protein [Cyanobacteria bacterium]|nr:glutathione S-transferase family protein [Cyanobacteriota bacterium]
MQLHQFRHSAFCEKVRLILAVKGLHADLIEVVPGMGQVALFRLSGQRQVPVLVDGEEVVADSTEIALYLEQRHPQPPLLPADGSARARVLLLEDWADTALAAGVRQALWQAAVADPVLRSALLPEATPSSLRRLVGALPGGFLSPLNDTVSEVINPLQASQLCRNLDQLLVLVRHSSYLEGERLTLADLAVVAQLSLLRFAADAGAPLAGRGVGGFGDNPLYGPLFAWRDRILAELGRG